MVMLREWIKSEILIWNTFPWLDLLFFFAKRHRIWSIRCFITGIIAVVDLVLDFAWQWLLFPVLYIRYPLLPYLSNVLMRPSYSVLTAFCVRYFSTSPPHLYAYLLTLTPDVAPKHVSHYGHGSHGHLYMFLPRFNAHRRWLPRHFRDITPVCPISTLSSSTTTLRYDFVCSRVGARKYGYIEGKTRKLRIAERERSPLCLSGVLMSVKLNCNEWAVEHI